jgi:hypothetical protein
MMQAAKGSRPQNRDGAKRQEASLKQARSQRGIRRKQMRLGEWFAPLNWLEGVFMKIPSAAIFGAACVLALTATAASADIVCNREGRLLACQRKA